MKKEIISSKIKGNFLIERLESTKQVFGYDMEDCPPGFELFGLSLMALNGKDPTFNQKREYLEKLLPYFIHHIKNNHECVILLDGDLTPGELTEAFRFICLSEENNRYYLPEMAKEDSELGHIQSWVTFDFNKTTLKEIPYGGTVVLEGIIYEKGVPNDFNVFFSRNWGNRDVKKDILSKCIVYFETNFDWDYLSFASRIPMDEIAGKLQKGLDSFDNEE